MVDVRSTLGAQSTATPQKINLGQGQAQCPCNARLRLWLRTKVRSASESLQAQFLWSVIELCVNIYIFDGRHIAKHFTILNMEIHFAPVILSILL